MNPGEYNSSLFTKNLVNRIRRQGPRIRLRLARRTTRARANLIPRLRGLLLLHTSILQNVGPLAARPSMTMLQMLPEVIRTEELLRIIALAEFMHGSQVLKTTVPVGAWEVGELFTAVPACIV